MYEGRDIYVFTVCSHFGNTDALIVTPLLVHVHRHMHAFVHLHVRIFTCTCISKIPAWMFIMQIYKLMHF